MSLSPAQIAAQAREFQANYALAALRPDQFATDLDMGPDEVRAIVAMDDGIDPARVWLLRDYLTNAIRARGLEPVPWTAMTEANRHKAEGWFGLSQAPTPVLDDGADA